MLETVPAPAPIPASDLELLRRYEPVIHYTLGEEFFPTDVERYLADCSLWVHHPNGRNELLVEEGKVSLDGEDVTKLGANARQERGLAYVPEDRGTKGLVQDFALYENNALKTYDEPPYSKWGWIFPRAMRRRAAEALRAYDVRPPDPDARAGSLSGGNQQKAILARELSGDPGVVIAAQPTRGVDVGAA